MGIFSTFLDLFEKHKDFYETTTKSGIEKNRKGLADIKITNQDGSPVFNAKVTVKQKNHEFRFGANLFMLDEFETEEKNELYKKHFSNLFNMATLPFYWNDLEPERGKPRYAKDSPKRYRRPAPDLCLEFCNEHNIEPREHALAYEAFFPEWLYGADTPEIKREFERRCAEMSQRYADKLRTIEVTNEMEWEKGRTCFYDDPDYVEWCFKTAERYFPNNQLVINEHTSCCWEDCCRATDKYYAYIQANMLKGARIDAVGMQFHIMKAPEIIYNDRRGLLDPINLYRHLDLYAQLGKPLQITEVTVPSYSWNEEDEAMQADLLEKLYTLWFSHPSVEQIIYWNLVDGYAHLWDPSPEKIAASRGDMTLGENVCCGGLFHFDMSPKLSYYRLKELLQKKWHTEAERNTDMNGNTSFKGFYGDYDVEICCNGKTHTHTISLSKKSNNHFEFIV